MKKLYAVRYKHIYNDGSILEVGALKNEIFEKIEEIKWILEAGNELPSGIDKFLGVK